MTGQKHIIWSSDPDYEDWRDDLEEQYPELSEQERMELICILHLRRWGYPSNTRLRCRAQVRCSQRSSWQS